MVISLIFATQIYATVQSRYLAIAALTLDSLLDLMAGGILWFTHCPMITVYIYKYPIGKLQVQPVGIIIFAAIMATLGMFVIHFDLKWKCIFVISIAYVSCMHRFQVLIQAVEQLIKNLPFEKTSDFQLQVNFICCCRCGYKYFYGCG